ncbi:hypothetical protein PIB30_098368 [Stylosanthes scabra]|uniref:Replication factor A C-terminal domain-containing protein n=1 Tax=Stylosanthes scabra TaxID=79078 RepID=A0ABU6WUT5_9FABA|nr:hypothetical protein [Stylosanthes scabra]
MLSKTGKELKRLAIIVEVLDKNRINCSLFDQHVDAILPHLDEAREEPLIVVLHYFKATRWNDNNGKTSVQSNFDLSKVHINPTLDEVSAFRERMAVVGHATSSKISHVSSQSAASAVGELTQWDVDVTKIDDVLKARQEGTLWIAGSVLALNVGEVKWCYKACGKCGKKVETVPTGRYECLECSYTDDKPKYKYKVQVMETEEFGYSPTLDNLIERKLLFKLKIRASNIERKDRIYTLAAMCEDEELVNKYLPEENTSQLTTTAVEMGGSNSGEGSPIFAKVQPDCGDHYSVALGDDSDSTKTPEKRPVSLISGSSSGAAQEELEGQLSTNKFSRRLPRKMLQIIEDDN